jgi:outer membrane receptor for ferrienterochelin and colicin
MPLFVNDYANYGKDFLIRYEPSLKALQLHGEIAYTTGEQFSISAGLNINQYSLQKELRAWGLLPLEFTSNLRWQILKDLWFKSDLWAWDGAQYLASNGQPGKSNPAFDLNAGVEFRLTKQLNLWLQMNNIFNDKYQRWNQYQSYGFNILGGIVFSFSDK